LPKLVAIAFTLITFPIILAYLPEENYGQFQFILALQIWLVAFSADNITSGAKRGIAKGLNGTFLFALFKRLRFLSVISLVGFIISFFIYQAGLITLAFLFLMMSFFLIFSYLPQVSYPEFLIAKKQFKTYAFLQTISFILIPTALALTAFLFRNIFIFALVHFSLTALVNLSAIFYIIFKNKLYSAYRRKEIDKECFGYGVKLIPASLLNTTANKITSFIIGPFFGFVNLAIFSVALKLEEKFRGLTKSVHNLLYSEFANVSQESLIRKIRLGLAKGFILSFLITIPCLILAYFYIDLFLPDSYQRAKLYFLILAFGLPAVFMQMILHTVLTANLRYKELTALIVLPNLIKILLIIVLGFFFKVIGVSLGVTLGVWLSFIFYYFLTIKRDFGLELVNRYPLLKRLSNF
jgi:O-antigen/teichoic acid export membrane protein